MFYEENEYKYKKQKMIDKVQLGNYFPL